MKPFHLQYSKHLRSARAKQGRVALAIRMRSILNEVNADTGENIGAVIDAARRELESFPEKTTREELKRHNTRLAQKIRRQALNEKAASSTAETTQSASVESAAPEVAAEEDDDDDGDGDGDPDSDRRPKRRNATPLPSAQLLRPKAACALLGIGRTKLWQLSERDPRFPRKIVLGPRCVGWRIDALNDYLRVCEQEG